MSGYAQPVFHKGKFGASAIVVQRHQHLTARWKLVKECIDLLRQPIDAERDTRGNIPSVTDKILPLLEKWRTDLSQNGCTALYCPPDPQLQALLGLQGYQRFMADLKTIYQADTIEKAERALTRPELKWDGKYPKVIESWRRNWPNLSLFFGYSRMIRKVMYPPNAIEAFHRQLRRVTKTKGSFTSDRALMKLFFLVQRDLTAIWQKPMHNWNRILAELAIL